MNSTDLRAKMALKSTRADPRNRSTPRTPKALELSWGEATRTRLLMAKCTPSPGWPMRTDTNRPLLTCPLHLSSKNRTFWPSNKLERLSLWSKELVNVSFNKCNAHVFEQMKRIAIKSSNSYTLKHERLILYDMTWQVSEMSEDETWSATWSQVYYSIRRC